MLCMECNSEGANLNFFGANSLLNSQHTKCKNFNFNLLTYLKFRYHLVPYLKY